MNFLLLPLAAFGRKTRASRARPWSLGSSKNAMELAPIAEAPPSFARYACKDTTFFSNSTHYFEDINTVCAQKMFLFSRKPLYYVWGCSDEIIRMQKELELK